MTFPDFLIQVEGVPRIQSNEEACVLREDSAKVTFFLGVGDSIKKLENQSGAKREVKFAAL